MLRQLPPGVLQRVAQHASWRDRASLAATCSEFAALAREHPQAWWRRESAVLVVVDRRWAHSALAPGALVVTGTLDIAFDLKGHLVKVTHVAGRLVHDREPEDVDEDAAAIVRDTLRVFDAGEIRVTMRHVYGLMTVPEEWAPWYAHVHRLELPDMELGYQLCLAKRQPGQRVHLPCHNEGKLDLTLFPRLRELSTGAFYGFREEHDEEVDPFRPLVESMAASDGDVPIREQFYQQLACLGQLTSLQLGRGRHVSIDQFVYGDHYDGLGRTLRELFPNVRHLDVDADEGHEKELLLDVPEGVERLRWHFYDDEVPDLARLTALTSLELGRVDATGLLPQLDAAHALRELSLVDCRVRDHEHVTARAEGAEQLAALREQYWFIL